MHLTILLFHPSVIYCKLIKSKQKMVQRYKKYYRITVFTIYGHGGHLCHVTWIICKGIGFILSF